MHFGDWTVDKASWKTTNSKLPVNNALFFLMSIKAWNSGQAECSWNCLKIIGRCEDLLRPLRNRSLYRTQYVLDS